MLLDPQDTVIAYLDSAQGHSPQEVVQALVQLEKKQRRDRSPIPAEVILGTWQLLLVGRQGPAHRRVKVQGRKIPHWITLQLTYRQSDPLPDLRGEIENSVRWRALQLKLTGPWQYLAPQNRMAFDFTRLSCGLGEKLIFSRSIRGGEAAEREFWSKKLKDQAFFTYFWVGDRGMAARGKGGGLALWKRVGDDGAAGPAEGINLLEEQRGLLGNRRIAEPITLP
ncbi:hypothetical protein [Lyngbya confervoides]|uniref:Plastid lipid-associated protein/fibrillin conserved domain-containing protein n=1 Tax=Lyngbya confervoides BDU141951 TaxID=1574623 RepID=A0ABD4T9Y8_9CYAN|nr:hypothetical protein [Lyngbya confervoides]MCM1985376.1 hypothetical protein [Lyngbya confervoides BDU141951]